MTKTEIITPLSPHALTFPLIMIGLGAWQFRRAARIARADAEIAAASPELRQSYAAHGFWPTRPGRVRMAGAAMIAIGLAVLAAPLLTERLG